MNVPNPSLIVTFGISGLAMLMLVAWPLLAARVTPRALVRNFGFTTTAWAAVWLGVAASGVLAAHPQLMMALGPSLVFACVWLSRSGAGTRLAYDTPLALLVAMQSFRLPLELVMHQAASEGTMPPQMTFGAGGGNYDIVTGASAVVLALILAARPLPNAVLWVWNILGTTLLLIIVGIAVTSTPMLALFGPERLNTWVFFAPFIWLPAVLVGAALFGHLLMFRRLLAPVTPPSA